MERLPFIPTQVKTLVRDAAYVTVGFGVLTMQRAQVRRRALARRLASSDLDDTLATLRSTVTRGVRDADALVDRAIGRIDSSVEPLKRRLPEPARAAVDKVRAEGLRARDEIRQLLENAAG